MVTGFWSSNVKRALDDFKERGRKKTKLQKGKDQNMR